MLGFQEKFVVLALVEKENLSDFFGMQKEKGRQVIIKVGIHVGACSLTMATLDTERHVVRNPGKEAKTERTQFYLVKVRITKVQDNLTIAKLQKGDLVYLQSLQWVS